MLRVIFYHVGKGDMSLILLPNGDAMMIDCYKAEEVVSGEHLGDNELLDRIEEQILEHRETLSRQITSLSESVVNERAKKKKVPIRVLAITHADRDHITAREELKARFDIGQLIDNGREYTDPSDATKDYLSFRAEMEKAGQYVAFKRAAANVWPASGATLDVLGPNRDISNEEDNNNQCLVIRIEYKGKSFLFTGDSPLDDWVNEKTGILTLHDGRVRSDVLNVSHHGSRSFFTPPGPRLDEQAEYKKEEYDLRALKKIKPHLSFITCSDDEEADHPHPIALELYQEYTNTNLPETRSSHVILSRYSKDLHHIIDTDGRLYMRTARSCINNAETSGQIVGPYLKGTVSSAGGYLIKPGIWVSRKPLGSNDNISFAVEAKGSWKTPISFDWWVVNNGQGSDEWHREFYTMASKDRKKQSTWSRDLRYEGVHLMQCHAEADDGNQWANWCVLVCYETSLQYAKRWLDLFPGCIDSSKINR